MGLEWDDPYEGKESRFEMAGTITHPGVDRYGETKLIPNIHVSVEGTHIKLTQYDVKVGKRVIATETRFVGRRTDAEINATKEHEDKHVANAKELHDRYSKMTGQVIGEVGRKEDALHAKANAERKLNDELRSEAQSHQPRTEWYGILRREGNSPDDIRKLYQNASAKGSSSPQSASAFYTEPRNLSGFGSLVSDALSGVAAGGGLGATSGAP